MPDAETTHGCSLSPLQPLFNEADDYAWRPRKTDEQQTAANGCGRQSSANGPNGCRLRGKGGRASDDGEQPSAANKDARSSYSNSSSRFEALVHEMPPNVGDERQL